MKYFKIILTALLVVSTVLCFTACVDSGNIPDSNDSLNSGNSGEITQMPSGSNTTQTPSSGDQGETLQIPSSGNVGGITQTPSGNETSTPSDDEQKVLVVYFSCTNTTKQWAQTLQTRLDADIYEIVPAIPYTEDDLKYYTNCRADQEQNDPTARPEISGVVEKIEQYDVIYIGYPIWHGQAPKIIYTFLESYDFAGKILIPFCTSASSSMGTSGTNLHNCAPNAVWKSGCRVSSTSNIDTLINMK